MRTDMLYPRHVERKRGKKKKKRARDRQVGDLFLWCACYRIPCPINGAKIGKIGSIKNRSGMGSRSSTTLKEGEITKMPRENGGGRRNKHHCKSCKKAKNNDGRIYWQRISIR